MIHGTAGPQNENKLMMSDEYSHDAQTEPHARNTGTLFEVFCKTRSYERTISKLVHQIMASEVQVQQHTTASWLWRSKSLCR